MTEKEGGDTMTQNPSKSKGYAGPFIKGMLKTAVNAKAFAEEQLQDSEFMATATQAQIRELKRMIESGEAAAKALEELRQEEEHKAG